MVRFFLLVAACRGDDDDPGDGAADGTSPSTGDTGTQGTTGDTGTAGGCALDVAVDQPSDFPTVPRFTVDVPAGADEIVVEIDDGTTLHRWTVGASPGETTIAFPVDPGVSADWSVETRGAETCRATGSLVNGAYTEGGLDSTGAIVAGRREWVLAPVQPTGQPPAVAMWNEEGEVLWRFESTLVLRTAVPAADGSGVWLLETQDGFASGFDPYATSAVQHVSWTGEVLEAFDVPAGHHDWQLGDGRGGDAGTFTLLGREDFDAVEAMCGGTYYGDVVFQASTDGSSDPPLYATSTDGFPIVSCTGAIPSGDGFAYSYFNGLERFGDTLGVSASGAVQGLLLGGSDGRWSFLAKDGVASDLTIVSSAGLYYPMVQAPHSVQCTEGIDWGDGAGATPGVLTCLAYHRRTFGGGQPCDTVDLFRARIDDGEADYLATFPSPGAGGDRWAGCSGTNDHGNTAFFGEPNPDGDGHTRVMLFAAADGAVTVVDLQVDATGASFALDYVLAPATVGATRGWFATPLTHLGTPHELLEP